MFKLNPIPKEIIRNQRTSVVKNYEGNDVTLILITNYSVKESKYEEFIKIEFLIYDNY